MASWETEKGTSNFEERATMDAQMSARDTQRSAASSTTSSSGGMFGSYSVVGINVAQVDNMCQAIRTWVEGIQSYLDGINPLADASIAFKSDDSAVENAVQKFAENVKEYCKNLCSDLLAFCDKLKDVKNAWITTTGNIAGTIESDTASSDAGSAYSETYQ